MKQKIFVNTVKTLRGNLCSRKGFSKVEALCAVIIVIFLIGISVPKFISLHNECQEGNTNYNLARLRSAIAAYYGNNKGTYPTDNLQSLIPVYIESIPFAKVKGHKKSNMVSTEFTGKGGWYYINDKNDPAWGEVKINLDGADSSGVDWRNH
ncbi:hypothetical protein Emin_0235 [Elusimicrobium minutum Pei191]|uniref:Uncharacterized protein n=1 Tax=Elusimicrobium minutum (strain Pei191) TaxID=445932 RepID=B2KB38_ELUMP|nr:type II secretion system protein [Elusimicrobium minutum]ACC97797.1 hypothetical protein Emin_0235 [Elusimicrobium minutum Pei191]